MLGLEEKKVAYDKKNINILLGHNFGPDYVKINGNATVPTLVLGDRKITDSTDILRLVKGSFGSSFPT